MSAANARAWQQGVQLAIDMIEACDDPDAMCLGSEYRGSRPQKNVVAGYLQKLREINDPAVHIAFGALLTDYISSCEGGGVPNERSMQKALDMGPIATEVQS